MALALEISPDLKRLDWIDRYQHVLAYEVENPLWVLVFTFPNRLDVSCELGGAHGGDP
jgi:hypothetical protein